jgi:hypothetical protein
MIEAELTVPQFGGEVTIDIVLLFFFQEIPAANIDRLPEYHASMMVIQKPRLGRVNPCVMLTPT